jgi:mannitol/fructose-specific phosphotransferase system IIA component (Ntr-type)
MLREVLTEDLVRPGADVKTKADVIDALLDLLCATGEVHDREQAREAVLANERRSSTGMQHGVAIPHAKTPVVDHLLAGVVVSRLPVDFASLDGKPCRIFVMTLSPPDRSGPHLQFLAEIGRLMKHRRAREAVLSASTPGELLAAFVGDT